MISLQVNRLSKRFGNVTALHEVSFAVEAGEVFGYLGPNGAGKTTTLRILLGLVFADHGEIRLLGNATTAPAAHRGVGYLPGELQLYGNLSGLDLLDYFARFRPQQPPVLRARLIEAFALEEATLRRKVKFLSHGTRQKLGLLLALQHDPELLLLDEPTTGLDPLVQQALHAILRDFAGRGRAVLFSSHVLSEVEALCSRVAILRRGEIVAIETIASLRRQMVRRMHVRFRQPAPADLARTPGVTAAEIAGSDATLWIQGEVNPILRRLAGADLDHFVFPEPELEDVFLSYYREQAAGDA
ncbi:MAG: putative ABC transporter ATP-binding protein NosF [bacterium]|nr:putative ABC transporter ATP-binding protein NosF [bacterium]